MDTNHVILLIMLCVLVECVASHDYGDALTKSILFYEGQRSGKLPSNQRVTWREDSALNDGSDVGMNMKGGYYDAGDNVKFNFPMAYTTTLLAWSVAEYGHFMGQDLRHAKDAIRWSTDYLLKATDQPGKVVAQVGDPYSDHNCWERPEDMDTLRTTYVVDQNNPGSEVSAEIAAALAASSIVFRKRDASYSKQLLDRAINVFDFADKYRGSYNTSVGKGVCPFYCDFDGYMDELIWGAAWLYRATNDAKYLNYVSQTINSNLNLMYQSYAEFGWDAKCAGINILLSSMGINNLGGYSPVDNAEKFLCAILPESPYKNVKYSPGGLLFKVGVCNIQHTTALSFLVLVYANHISPPSKKVQCGNIAIDPNRLVQFAKTQVDYILGSNPMGMSYMVGYSNKYPLHIHHRGSSLPSKHSHPQRIQCKEGTPYYQTTNPNPNVHVGAVVGGPEINDVFDDARTNPGQSEPTTYVNAPLIGLLAYFNAHKTT